MTRVVLISDTHSYLGDDITQHFKDADEIWHAGDIGHSKLIDELETFGKPVKAVYGNIDDHQVRAVYPLNNIFICDGLKVLITHIGGYPGRYTKRVNDLILQENPGLYICGHSHICKVIKDSKNSLLHMNPGACGHSGFHHIRTFLKFEIKDGKVGSLKLVELGPRGRKN